MSSNPRLRSREDKCLDVIDENSACPTLSSPSSPSPRPRTLDIKTQARPLPLANHPTNGWLQDKSSTNQIESNEDSAMSLQCQSTHNTVTSEPLLPVKDLTSRNQDGVLTSYNKEKSPAVRRQYTTKSDIAKRDKEYMCFNPDKCNPRPVSRLPTISKRQR